MSAVFLRRTSMRLAASFLFALLACPPVLALPHWTLEIDSVRLGEARVAGIRLASETGGEAADAVEMRAASLRPRPDATAFGPFMLHCPGALAAVVETLCRGGTWNLALIDGWPQLTGALQEVALGDGGTTIATRGSLGGLAWSAGLESAAGTFTLALEIPAQPVGGLSFLETRLPALGWATAGRLSGTAEVSGGTDGGLEAGGQIEVSGLDFDSPDGLYAGLGVEARLAARLESPGETLVALDGRLAGGELLLQDFYRDFSGKAIDLSARVALEDEAVDLQRLAVSDGDALHIAGQARLPLGGEAAGAPQLLLRELRLQFPAVYERYLESLASVWTLDGLETGGTVSWTGDWSPGSARSGTLNIEGLRVLDEKRGRFAIRGVNGTLETGSTSRLSWRGASFEKLDLGAGAAAIELAQESVGLLEPLRIDVFGGVLSLEELAVGFPRGGKPEIQLEAAISGVDMREMTRALGWPEFSGTLSGNIPGINWSEGVIGIEGALDFEVFGGRVMLTDLTIERPFGVLPSLAANITADALDLEQLTQTFEFGRIAGRIDGYVRDLRMLDWRPVQFDAWFGTPAGGGRQDISRKAVHHLATIGGGSSTAVLAGPVLRLFNNFSYRRLGLGCRLQDNVCNIRGIEEQGDAVLLLEGAGIPKISILAYNRAVDWPQLVAELTAVSGGEEVRIGQ